MPADISADVAFLGGVWAEGVLYGIHIVVFITLCYIFTSSAYTRGRERLSQILLAFAIVMFIFSTTHVALTISDFLQGFVYEGKLTPGGTAAFYRNNVFPKRKAIYIVNTLLGDSLLIWRVYVIYGGCNWIVCPCFLVLLGTMTCGIKAIVANGIYASSSVFDPSIFSWITSFFVLTIVTQIAATTLIAVRIYAASQLFQLSEEVEAEMGNIVNEKEANRGRKYEPQRGKYLAALWLVVESGVLYSSAAIVLLVTYLLRMNAGVIMELMMSQLSAMVPMIIIVRVGLGLAYQGASITPSHQREYQDPSSSAPSSGRRNNSQSAKLQASSPQEDDGMQNISLGSLSSRSKLDIGTELDSRVAAGDNSYGRDRNSGEMNLEKEGKTV